jgi:hypothetical protein
MTPLLLSGGGLKMGQVIGQSDKQAAKPIDRSHRPEHLLSTILHTVFDVGQLRLEQQVPREVIRMAEISPIAGVF